MKTFLSFLLLSVILAGCGVRKHAEKSEKSSSLQVDSCSISRTLYSSGMQDSTLTLEWSRTSYYPPYVDSAGNIVKDAVRSVEKTRAVQKAVNAQSREEKIDSVVVGKNESVIERTQQKQIRRTAIAWWKWVVAGVIVAGWGVWKFRNRLF